jgi:hypothetical protein
MKTSRVHILSTVNAANVSKAGAQYTVRDVCAAVDEIVMNGMLYPGDQLAAGAKSLEGKPAPAGHPKDAAGNHISATSGDALLTAFAGAICRNARHEGGRTLVDVVVNEAQALAHPDGAKLVARLNDAISGSNAEPIHVSTGVLVRPITANGESRGKRYTRIATDPVYDHLAFLLHERGAGTPEEGVGMFLNADGQPAEVEAVALNTEPEDRRTRGLMAWVMRLLGNSAGDLSFDQIQSGLYKALGEGAWLQEVFDRYAIWTDRDGKLYRQDYSVGSDGSVAWSGTAQEVTRRVEYEPVANRQEIDTVKELLIAALNAAGIKTEGMADAALLAAYNAHVSTVAKAPDEAQLNAATVKVSEFEQAANAAAEQELTTIAAELATNSKVLTAADFKAMGLARCKELKAAGVVAAPVLTGNSGGGTKASAYAAYDPNEHFETKKEAV